MSPEQTLKDAGAQCVAGDLILNREIVGQYRNGVFSLTMQGVLIVEEAQAAKQAEVLKVVKDMSQVQAQQQQTPRRGRRAAVDKDPEIGEL